MKKLEKSIFSSFCIYTSLKCLHTYPSIHSFTFTVWGNNTLLASRFSCFSSLSSAIICRDKTSNVIASLQKVVMDIFRYILNFLLTKQQTLLLLFGRTNWQMNRTIAEVVFQTKSLLDFSLWKQNTFTRRDDDVDPSVHIILPVPHSLSLSLSLCGKMTSNSFNLVSRSQFYFSSGNQADRREDRRRRRRRRWSWANWGNIHIEISFLRLFLCQTTLLTQRLFD